MERICGGYHIIPYCGDVSTSHSYGPGPVTQSRWITEDAENEDGNGSINVKGTPIPCFETRWKLVGSSCRSHSFAVHRVILDQARYPFSGQLMQSFIGINWNQYDLNRTDDISRFVIKWTNINHSNLCEGFQNTFSICSEHARPKNYWRGLDQLMSVLAEDSR